MNSLGTILAAVWAGSFVAMYIVAHCVHKNMKKEGICVSVRAFGIEIGYWSWGHSMDQLRKRIATTQNPNVRNKYRRWLRTFYLAELCWLVTFVLFAIWSFAHLP
jgi:hypothetical protein